MGTGNALRATETFTLIQLEEERQKLKKKELLKSMLTDSEFSIKGQCAINLMMTKLDIINTFLLMKYKRNFIQMKTWRLKSYDSVCKKMQKKGLDLNFDLALEKINDLIGVRAVCAYVDDIYKVADLIEKQQDIHILKIKDYVQQPKKSGYQSLHLIVEVPVTYLDNSIPERKPVDQTRIAASNCCHGLLGQPRPSIALQTRTKAGSSDQ